MSDKPTVATPSGLIYLGKNLAIHLSILSHFRWGCQPRALYQFGYTRPALQLKRHVTVRRDDRNSPQS